MIRRQTDPLSPGRYAVAAPLLLLFQHLLAAGAYWVSGAPLDLDAEFWILPLRKIAALPGLPIEAGAAIFMAGLVATWLLASLSLRRAAWSGIGHGFAALTIIPGLQIVAVASLLLLPRRAGVSGEPPYDAPAKRADAGHIVWGVAAGVGIIVFAVLVSAVIFGSYGWGLFVLTPFTVGLATAYLANRPVPLPTGETLPLVLAACLLGTVALVMFALEGVVCILMAAPLGALAAAAGGAAGRAAALAVHGRGNPLMSVAILPAVFALEAAMPPAVPIHTDRSIVVAEPPEAVWAALVSDEAIASPPGPVALAGLAYPVGGRLLAAGVGGERHGLFSTGVAKERITEWSPGRRLAFTILSQPPAMSEVSPYPDLAPPHIDGYFQTLATRFEIEPLPDGGSRLTARAEHILRIEPVLYWEPLARWAIDANVERVLADLKQKAERRR